MGAASTLDQLWGSIPPLVTPFRGGEVDYETYARLVEAQVAAGSHGVLVNGTTGEPSLLTVDERNRLVDVAMEAAAGRLPVVAATGSQSLLESRQLTVHAAEAGVAAVLVVTPYYVRPPQRGIVAYYAQVVDGLETPWLVYHIPGRAAVGVTVDTLEQLHDASPTFVGMKHAVNDLGPRVRRAGPARPGLPGLRRPRGAELPDDGGRGLRADERGRQRGARPAGRDLRGRP